MDEKAIREALAVVETVAHAVTVPEHHRRSLITAVSSIRMGLVMTAEQHASVEQQYEAARSDKSDKPLPQ